MFLFSWFNTCIYTFDTLLFTTDLLDYVLDLLKPYKKRK